MGEVLPQLEYKMPLLNSHSQEMDRGTCSLKDRGSLKGAGCLTEAKTIEKLSSGHPLLAT